MTEALQQIRLQMRTEGITLESKVDLLLLMILQGVATLGRDGIIKKCDYPFCQTFGYKDETSLVGQPFEILIPERFRARHKELVAKWWKSPMPIRMDRDTIQGLHKDGTEFELLAGLLLETKDTATFAVKLPGVQHAKSHNGT